MNKKPVYYWQTDPRWKGLPYQAPGETATIGGSGCGPTCAAMAIQTLTGKVVTPVDTCRWAEAHGYKAKGQGTYYSYFVPQLAAWGLSCKRLTAGSVYGKPDAPVHQEAFRLLQQGWYIIACMGRGLWTRSGHFVLAWWADGKVYINDPASRREARLRGDPETFRRQVKQYWAVDARTYNHPKEDDNMTYEQFAAFMDRYRQEQGKKGAAMPELLADAQALGITDGSRPRDFATREECAVMVRRIARGGD